MRRSLRRFLRRLGVFTDEFAQSTKAEAEAAMRAGIAAAEATPPPDPELLFSTPTSTRRRDSEMAELTLVEAVNDALHCELARDENVMVLGEDVGRAGGVFRATAGLRDRFGPNRCFDTPLAEAGLLGAAVGLCMAGWRPVCEMQYDAFSYPCLDQLITHVGRYHWRTGGRMEFPITIRMPYGGGVRAPELRDDSPRPTTSHTRDQGRDSLHPRRCQGLACGRDRTLTRWWIFEPKLVYRTARGEVPEGDHIVPLGKARIAREGSDVTLIAYGAMIPVCERAADGARGGGVVRGDRHPLAPAARRPRRSWRPWRRRDVSSSSARRHGQPIPAPSSPRWSPSMRSSTCRRRCFA